MTADTPDYSTLDHLPCPICGESSYEWGVVRGYGAWDTGFLPGNAGAIARYFTFKTTPMKARKCNHCGNVQLFTVQKK